MKTSILISFIFCLLSGIAFSQIPTTGLLAHYPFNGNAHDQSGNGFDGVVNGADLAFDRHSLLEAAYEFDGFSDHILIPNDSALKPNFPFSISLWVKIDNFGSNTKPIFTSDDSPNNYSGYWLTYSSSGNINAAYGDGGGLGSGHRVTKQCIFPIDNINWFHIVAVFNGLNDIDIYINSILEPGNYSGVASTMENYSYSGAIGRTSAPLSGVSYHDGKIDDIRIYDVALDTAAIVALYNENPVSSLSVGPFINGYKFYPNPIADFLTIESQNLSAESEQLIIIKDVMGKTIYEGKIATRRQVLPKSTFKTSGLYLMEILDNQGKILRKEKLIVPD